MALIMLGKTQCAICRVVLQSADVVHGFPAFVCNEADPLLLFNDAAVHRNCLLKHPLGRFVQERVTELFEKTGPGNRFCIVCKEEILDYKAYFCVGHLSWEKTDPLHTLNYAQFHRACVPRWSDLKQFLVQLEKLKTSGRWQGPSLDFLIKELIDMSANAT